MNKRIRELATEAGLQPFEDCGPGYVYKMEKFAELIVKDCVDIIESHRIWVGNSSTEELAAKWTYDSLIVIRDKIKDRFGANDENRKVWS